MFPHPPVRGLSMHPVEPTFGILRWKPLRIEDVPSKEHWAKRRMTFIGEGNKIAHPINVTSNSVAKVIAGCRVTTIELAARAA